MFMLLILMEYDKMIDFRSVALSPTFYSEENHKTYD
jgi:hypothetical protein